MSTGCLRKSRVVSRDWSRSPLSVLPDSMTLCGSMSSRSMKEAVLGGPENMVCARRGLIMVSGAGVWGWHGGFPILMVSRWRRAAQSRKAPSDVAAEEAGAEIHRTCVLLGLVRKILERKWLKV